MCTVLLWSWDSFSGAVTNAGVGAAPVRSAAIVRIVCDPFWYCQHDLGEG
jgi:hypothetical protein